MAEPPGPEGPLRVGPYTVLERLSEGPYGRTYLAAGRGRGRVAVTLLDGAIAQDPDLRRRLAREVAAARRIPGARIAAVLDADTMADPPWVATAFVAGLPLDAVVGRHGPLPAATVAVLGAGAAEGLAAEHAAGLLRGRMLPADVTVAADGPVLVSPAVVRAAAAGATMTGAVLGAPDFLPPETLMSLPAGSAADVFSLACVLVYAATGRSPFAAEPETAAAYRVIYAAPDLAGVPAALVGPLGAALDKDPDRRPAAAELAEALEAVEAPFPGEGWLPDPVAREVADAHPAQGSVADSATRDARLKARPATLVPLPGPPVVPAAPPVRRGPAPPPPPPAGDGPARVARAARRRLAARGAFSAWDMSGATALDTRLAPPPRRHAPPPRLVGRPEPRSGAPSPGYADAADPVGYEEVFYLLDRDLDGAADGGRGPSDTADPRAGGETEPPPWAVGPDVPGVPSAEPAHTDAGAGRRTGLLPALLAGAGALVLAVVVGTVSSEQASPLVLAVLGAVAAAGLAVPTAVLTRMRPLRRRRRGGAGGTPPSGSTESESSE
ncbi:hypothetical protein ACFONH_19695 [Streptomonospora nanhaiensis]|uniref:protein kinase domain-containing protein n=2 Tax=Streptomonospora nanhaiensis TaxID=1323731 RepID=UPI003606DCE4